MAPPAELVVGAGNPTGPGEVVYIRHLQDSAGDWTGRRLVIVQDPLQVLDHPYLKNVLSGSYRVVCAEGADQQLQQFYANVADVLRARSKAGFLMHLRNRPALLKALEFSRLEGLGPEWVSIKTVQRLFREQTPGECERERLMWRVLEELVR